MSSHLKAGELYAFATRDGSCIVGKLLNVAGNHLDLYVFDRAFRPLTLKADILEALAQHDSAHDYRIAITRRHFALMYPLWLAETDVKERDFLANRQTSITIEGKPARFNRKSPYWAFVLTGLCAWLFMFVLLFNSVPGDAESTWALGRWMTQVLHPAVVCIIFASLATAPWWMLLVLRWVEATRTGFSVRRTPTLELTLPLPMDEAFTRCRDTLGASTSRDFDFVDRRSGFIQGRVNHFANQQIPGHNLVRILCYRIDEAKTGVIISCVDIDACGVLGTDFWILKKLVAAIQAEPSPNPEVMRSTAEVVFEKARGLQLRRLMLFGFTAVFASFSAVLLKMAMLGDSDVCPLLTVTVCATICGFLLFSMESQAPSQNS